MPINKVIYCGETLIDLSDDTVTAGSLISGYTAHGANGISITGSLDIWALSWNDLSSNQYNNEIVEFLSIQPIMANKIIYCGGILIDLTSDTIVTDALLAGYFAHDKNGRRITGSLRLSEVTWDFLDEILL